MSGRRKKRRREKNADRKQRMQDDWHAALEHFIQTKLAEHPEWELVPGDPPSFRPREVSPP